LSAKWAYEFVQLLTHQTHPRFRTNVRGNYRGAFRGRSFDGRSYNRRGFRGSVIVT
jgi:hypothetical protein